jgi:hypothetical protein
MRAAANFAGKLAFQEERARAKDAFLAPKSAKLAFPEKKKPYVLSIIVDGAVIHVRKSAGKSDAAESPADPGPAASAAPFAGLPGGAKSSRMEYKLGLVRSSDNFARERSANNEYGCKPGKREYTAFIGPAEIFKCHLLAAALRNGRGACEKTFPISDVAEWVRNMKDEPFPGAAHIPDSCHLCEKVSAFAKRAFGSAESPRKPRPAAMAELLKAGGSEDVLRETKKLGPKRLKKSEFSLAEHIQSNEAGIGNATHCANGWLAGSGATESLNRTAFRQRLSQPGMRWSLEPGQFLRPRPLGG